MDCNAEAEIEIERAEKSESDSELISIEEADRDDYFGGNALEVKISS